MPPVVVPPLGEAAAVAVGSLVAVGSALVTTDVVPVAGDPLVAGGGAEVVVSGAVVELVCGGVVVLG